MKIGKIIWKLLSGVLMIFMLVVLGSSVLHWHPSFQDREIIWWGFGGSLGGSLLFTFHPLIPVYVFGHELTHWLLGKLYRRRTSKFRVGRYSGSVRIENPNIIIILGPYIFPLYMVVFLLVYGIFWRLIPWPVDTNVKRYVDLGCSAVAGMLYAYHLVLTIKALSQMQEDLRFNGWLYSMLFILLFNFGFVYIGLVVLSSHPLAGIWELVESSKGIWLWINEKIGLYC